MDKAASRIRLPIKICFLNILGTSYLPLYLSYIDYKVLKRNLVLFGGD